MRGLNDIAMGHSERVHPHINTSKSSVHAVRAAWTGDRRLGSLDRSVTRVTPRLLRTIRASHPSPALNKTASLPANPPGSEAGVFTMPTVERRLLLAAGQLLAVPSADDGPPSARRDMARPLHCDHEGLG